MKYWKIFAALSAIVLTLVFGGVHRILAGKGFLPGPSVSVEQLEQLPKQFGSWTLVADTEITEQALEILQCDTSLSRRYVHAETGSVLEIMLLVGPAKTLTAHTPEVCYGTQAFVLLDNDQVIQGTRNRDDTLRLVELQGRDVNQTKMNVAYGWNDGSGWKAPAVARLRYAGTRNLVKIQLALQTPSPDQDVDSLWQETIDALLPEIAPLLAQNSPAVER
jgi:hypothetical protein